MIPVDAFGQVAGLSVQATVPMAAYKFLHGPLPLDDYWLVLLVPLVVAISLVYKAIKLDDLSQLLRQTLYLATQIIFLMALAAGVLWLLTAAS